MSLSTVLTLAILTPNSIPSLIGSTSNTQVQGNVVFKCESCKGQSYLFFMIMLSEETTICLRVFTPTFPQGLLLLLLLLFRRRIEWCGVRGCLCVYMYD